MKISVVKAWFKNHLPAFQQILSVYGIVVIVIYGWTLYWFVWKLPSWLYYLSFPEIMSIFAYATLVNFLESLTVIAVPILISLLLPVAWFRTQFVARGSVLSLILLGFLMRYVAYVSILMNNPLDLGFMPLLVILAMILLIFIAGKISFLRKLIEEIAYRAVIFVYISIPISMISFLVVLIRNVLALRMQ